MARLLLVFAPLLAALVWPSAVPAVTPNPADSLPAVRAEITRLEQQLAALRDRESDLAGRIAAIDLEIRLQEKRTLEAATARSLAVTAVAEAEQAVAREQRDLDLAKASMRRRLTGLYHLGRQGYLRLLLAAQPGTDVLSSLRVVRFFARRDKLAIGRYEEARAGLARQRDELLAHRAEVEQWTTQEQARGRALTDLRRRHTDVLAAAERERLNVASRAVDLAAREQQLATFLERLDASNLAPLAGTPMQGFRGALEWPLAGTVTTGFGPRLDPRYRTLVPHRGIELATATGATVHVVYPGKVLFAAPFEGYGPTVVVLHAGKIFTLYAGLAELRVAKGDVLSLSQPLGTVENRLYFELRVDNHPENPLDWLR